MKKHLIKSVLLFFLLPDLTFAFPLPWSRSFNAQGYGYNQSQARNDAKYSAERIIQNYQWSCTKDGGHLLSNQNYPICTPGASRWTCRIDGSVYCR